MKNMPIIVFCILGIILSGCSKPHKPKPDLLTLQGTWTLGNNYLIINGTNFEDIEPNSSTKGTFSLREETTPKQLEALCVECSMPQFVGKTIHAIYKIEGRKLTLSESRPGNPDAPTSFDAQGAAKFIWEKRP
jgi:uncharacterized protein (TIGR03067 family)